MDSCIVDFHQVVFSHGATEVLHEVSFQLRRGEVIGLLGPKGAGRTTTLKIIINVAVLVTTAVVGVVAWFFPRSWLRHLGETMHFTLGLVSGEPSFLYKEVLT